MHFGVTHSFNLRGVLYSRCGGAVILQMACHDRTFDQETDRLTLKSAILLVPLTKSSAPHCLSLRNCINEYKGTAVKKKIKIRNFNQHCLALSNCKVRTSDSILHRPSKMLELTWGAVSSPLLTQTSVQLSRGGQSNQVQFLVASHYGDLVVRLHLTVNLYNFYAYGSHY